MHKLELSGLDGRRSSRRVAIALFGIVALFGVSTVSAAGSGIAILDLSDVAPAVGSVSREEKPVAALGTVVESTRSDFKLIQPIQRGQLSSELQELTTDQVLELANSPEFAQARAEWGDDERFVFQVGYQLEFRSKVDFMSASSAHVAELLLERPENMGFQEMNLYMSDAEVVEMQRRDGLGSAMESIVRELTGVSSEELVPSVEGVRPLYGPNYGGIFQDQLDGGRIVVAVVERHEIGENQVEKLQELAGGKANLKIIEQPFSFNELEEYRDQLEEDLLLLGLPPHVAAVWGPEGRRLEVTMDDPSVAIGNVGKGVPVEAFSIIQGTPFHEAGLPSSTHSLDDQQPGLKIQVYDGVQGRGCTWGFNGHTSYLHYIITAGHCLGVFADNPGNYVGDVDIWQNNSPSRDLTATPYVYSKNTETWDAARVSSGYANDNCYHGSGSGADAHCYFTMSVRSLHNQWELGSDRTCSSLGATNDRKCGYIVDDDFGPNRIVVDMAVAPGDSGSGGQWGNRIDGILTDRSDTQAFYQTAYHVQYTLGNGYFYFNCAVGRTTRSDPGGWGVCPAVNP